MDEYFKDDGDRCMSCAECLKTREKILQYKYPKGLQSNYSQTFIRPSTATRAQEFNMDKEKEKVKVKRTGVSKDYTTTHKNEFKPFLVTMAAKQDVGRQEMNAELNNPCFIGSTTYTTTYQKWGSNPPLLPVKERPKVMNVKFDHKSTYKYEYELKQKGLDQGYLQYEMARQKKMQRECKQKNVRG